MTKEERSIRMSHIHSASTKPELRLRHALWNLGFRYRVNVKSLPGSPDIVLAKYRTVVFVHGCFWHGHNNCKTSHIPKTDTTFWTAKIARNQERDQEVWRQLEAKGWFVIIDWECELKKAVFDETIGRVREEILQNGEEYRSAKEERLRARESWLQMRKAQREKEVALKSELQKGRPLTNMP